MGNDAESKNRDVLVLVTAAAIEKIPPVKRKDTCISTALVSIELCI